MFAVGSGAAMPRVDAEAALRAAVSAGAFGAVAVAGSRSLNKHDDWAMVADVLGACLGGRRMTAIVTGGAKGVDKIAADFAKDAKVPLEVHKADWRGLGPGAGMANNTKIVDACDVLVFFQDGDSPGTADAIRKARTARKPVFGMRRLASGRWEVCV